jgi:hypothetical protein
MRRPTLLPHLRKRKKGDTPDEEEEHPGTRHR